MIAHPMGPQACQRAVFACGGVVWYTGVMPPEPLSVTTVRVLVTDDHVMIEESETTVSIICSFEDSYRAEFGPDWVRPWVKIGLHSLSIDSDSKMLPQNWEIS